MIFQTENPEDEKQKNHFEINVLVQYNSSHNYSEKFLQLQINSKIYLGKKITVQKIWNTFEKDL